MRRYYPLLWFSLILIILVYSCKSDDDVYVSLEVKTAADFVEVFQNNTIEINVLENDLNVPTEGTLSTNTATQGTVQVLDPNNTSQDPSDDIILYTPDISFVGEDNFQYTLCNADGTCVSENVIVSVLSASVVVFNIDQVPYAKLSDYNFFAGDLANLNPVFGVLPYEPISSLFSDYALKKRFIWMPNGVKANYTEDFDILDFPTGTILIKTFYYDNVQPNNSSQLIETRLMILKDDGWIFANYLWNTEQTEAVFDLEGGYAPISWIQNGETKQVNYRIPSESECFTCHTSLTSVLPIGLKPQNLNSNYNYTEGISNQLDKFIEMGYLEDNIPASINTVVNWEDTSQTLNDRMRSYVDINCAHCHSDDRYCDYRPLRLAFFKTNDPTNLGVCVEPDTPIDNYVKIIEPGNINESLMYFRLSTTQENYRMPLLGRTIVHEEGISLVGEWINSLTENCN